MRRTLRVAVGLSAVGLLALAALPSQAASPAERSLFGIRIWRPWSEVLSKFGQPTRIEVGEVTTGGAAAGGTGMGMPGGPAMGMSGPFGRISGLGGGGPQLGSGSMSDGGLPGLPGASGPPMGMMSGPPPGVMGRRGMGPMGMSGGYGGGYYGRGPGGGGKMGAAMGEGEGGPPSMGMMGGPMGFGGIGGGGEQNAETTEGEITWIYDRPGGNTMMFLFNKDGRVIQIQSFGYKNGGVTSRGISLGDPVSKVYRLYGWTDNTVKAGDSLTLDYSVKSHVAFQMLDRHNGLGYRVVGITVAQTEKPGR